MKQKIYFVSSDIDFEKVAYATLKKVYSTTLFPRVLSNIQNSVLEKNFKKNLDFECFFIQNSRIFAKKVHFDCFDMGLFFFEKHGKLCLKLYDGNGLNAGSFVTNIFDYVFSLNKKNFEDFKIKVKFEYGLLQKENLLVQKFPEEAI